MIPTNILHITMNLGAVLLFSGTLLIFVGVGMAAWNSFKHREFSHITTGTNNICIGDCLRPDSEKQSH